MEDVKQTENQTEQNGNPLGFGPLEVLTARQVSELLKISRLTLYSLVRRKRIRPLSGFRHLRFSAIEVARFVSEMR